MTAAASLPTIYIPHLRGVDRLRETLAALTVQDAPHRTIVVDNASEDGSREMVEREFPEVTIFPLEQNVGFGKALNEAVRFCGGDPILFLNDDVRCDPRFLGALLRRLRGDVDMVAGVLVQDDRPDIVDSAGVVAERDTLMGFDHLHGASVAELATAERPLGPTGAAALFRRAAFESVGGYDERIFAYFEDLDLALRMRAAGFQCDLAEDALAVHSMSATLGSRSSAKFELTGWSRGYLLQRYGIMRKAPRAFQALVVEGAICGGQILRHRTTAGVRGRLKGGLAARRLRRREAPVDGLMRLSPLHRMRLRAARRR